MENFHIPELIPGRRRLLSSLHPKCTSWKESRQKPAPPGSTMHLEFQRRKRNAARRRILHGIVTQEASC